jgi:hypothetical protein
VKSYKGDLSQKSRSAAAQSGEPAGPEFDPAMYPKFPKHEHPVLQMTILILTMDDLQEVQTC